jgi:hypothetical protein
LLHKEPGNTLIQHRFLVAASGSAVGNSGGDGSVVHKQDHHQVVVIFSTE